jgi:hypothetical protein
LGANDLGVGEAMHSKDAWAVLGLPYNATPLQVHLWGFASPYFSDELHEELLDSGKEDVFNALNYFWLLKPHKVCAQNVGSILGSPGNTTGSAYAITSRERELSLSPPITLASELRIGNSK